MSHPISLLHVTQTHYPWVTQLTCLPPELNSMTHLRWLGAENNPLTAGFGNPHQSFFSKTFLCRPPPLLTHQSPNPPPTPDTRTPRPTPHQPPLTPPPPPNPNPNPPPTPTPHPPPLVFADALEPFRHLLQAERPKEARMPDFVHSSDMAPDQ